MDRKLSVRQVKCCCDLLAAAAVSDGVDSLLAAADTEGLPPAGTSQSARGKKRRNYRHNQEQINAMEIYLKDYPHPDQNQRNDLAMSSGLDPTQVKFWFQNKRTQLKEGLVRPQADLVVMGGVGAASIDGVAALLAAAAASDGVDALVAAAGTEGLSLDVSSGDAPQIEMEQNKRETGGFGAIDGVDALLAAAAVSDGVEALLAAAAVSDGVDALLAAAAVSDGVDALLAAADTQGLAPAAGSSQSAGGNKRRNYRHNQEQINAMEIYFKDHPHPDQNQRNDLAMSLGLDPTQVKFWFQNKRTQLKNQSEHEKKVALLSENSMLRAEIQHSTEALRRSRCHECSGSLMDQENNLRRENIRLKEELEMRKPILANLLHGQNPQDLPKELQQYTSELSQNGANLSFPHHKNA
ncbi:hypothetical protein ACET3Z_003022 [Daucus carota]